MGGWGVGKTREGEGAGVSVVCHVSAGAAEGARVGEAEGPAGRARGVAVRSGCDEAPAVGAADAVGVRLTATAGPHAAPSAASKVRTMSRNLMRMSRPASLA